MKKKAYISFVDLRNYYLYSVGLSVDATRKIMSSIDYSEKVEVVDLPVLGMAKVTQGENSAIIPHGVIAYTGE